MNTAGKLKNNYQRTTLLSFDEIKLSELYEYDQKENEIVGPSSYMQVIMPRDLFDTWKQPVYIRFDQKVAKLTTRGGLHDNPSSLNAIYRNRMILLGKNPGMVHTHSNVVTPIGTEKEDLLAVP
ncbi:hypothetical protein NQ314_007781 [Rhamnusium bicolor]|uniref:Uncharacterized protein n=1 Tax=Rhamnusium bicolor TaxID=1586634 RepID=A0AAV8YHV5_9CUCU|nr:hypothetical protein NQ314_007781 [Rhamnusium bicolor]